MALVKLKFDVTCVGQEVAEALVTRNRKASGIELGATGWKEGRKEGAWRLSGQFSKTQSTKAYGVKREGASGVMLTHSGEPFVLERFLVRPQAVPLCLRLANRHRLRSHWLYSNLFSQRTIACYATRVGWRT